MVLVWPCHKLKEKDMQAKDNEFLNNNKQLKIQLQTNKISKREKYDDLQKIKDRILQSHQCYHCH